MIELSENIQDSNNLEELMKTKVLIKQKIEGLTEKINMGFELMNFALVEELLLKLKYYNNLVSSMNL